MLVLPLVPVTPKTRIAWDGQPWNHALSGPLTARGSPTMRSATARTAAPDPPTSGVPRKRERSPTVIGARWGTSGPVRTERVRLADSSADRVTAPLPPGLTSSSSTATVSPRTVGRDR